MAVSKCAVTVAVLCSALAPAFAQDVNLTRGILENRPYTLIYPADMQASGGGDDPLVINHPDAPLQCTLDIVRAEETGWTPEAALEALDTDALAEQWSANFPGFEITASEVTDYQSGPALLYEGRSEGSPMGMPISLVHTEAVTGARGYILDCFFASEVATDIRPMVDFIVENFSTRSDADCCVADAPPQVEITGD